MLSLSEDQSNMEWVDGSIGLFIHPLVQGGNMTSVGTPSGPKLCCWLAVTHLIYLTYIKLLSSSVTILITVPIRDVKSANMPG